MLAVYLVSSIMCGNIGGGNKNNRYLWTDEETKIFLELDGNTLNSHFYFSFFIELSKDSHYFKM